MSLNLSLHGRLIAVCFGVSLFTLMTASGAFLWFRVEEARQEESRVFAASTRAIAQASAAAVAFSDQQAASELLQSLRTLPEVHAAFLFTQDGTLLANFALGDHVATPPSPRQDPSLSQFVTYVDGYLQVQQTITQGADVLGSLVVVARTAQIRTLIGGTIQIAALVLVLGAVASFGLASILAGALARPLRQLAHTMTEVSTLKDYTKRVAAAGFGEVAELTANFNEMLSEIESRDLALLEHQNTLEARVASRTIALRQEQEQLLNLIRNAPVAIALLDNDLVFIEHSQKWLADYKLPDASLVGRRIYDVLPALPEKWKEFHRRALAGERIMSPEDRLEVPGDAPLHLRWAMHPWQKHDGRQGGVVLVTDRIDDLVASREAALRTARLRSEFLTNMSHELRTPLNGIIGFTELLKDEASLPPHAIQQIDAIESSGRVLLALINDTLDFAKLEQRKLILESTRFRLQDAVNTAVRIFVGQAEQKGLRLVVDTTKGGCDVVGDPLRIQQVLMNLVGNAIKFTERGEVRVTIDSVTTVDDRYSVTITVSDSGIGIPAEKQGEIFNPFTQADGSTSRRYGGTGLGLAICAELAKLLDGEIQLRSTPGVGSTFLFTFRLAHAAPRALALTTQPAQPHCPTDAPARRVLVAEDNPMNQKLVVSILQKAGYDVQVAANGQVALELLRQQHFDIVLMDLQMPVLGGLDAIAQIRSNPALATPRLPIVALTAHAFSEHRDECLRIGADRYLTKPLNRGELLETIRQLTSE